MNHNIQRLIQSLSPDKLKEIQNYVVSNMSEEIRQASVHGSLSESMQNDLDNLIIKFLEENYQDDIKHIIKVSEEEVRDKVENMVANSIFQMANSPIETTNDKAPEQSVVTETVKQPVFRMTSESSNQIAKQTVEPEKSIQSVPVISHEKLSRQTSGVEEVVEHSEPQISYASQNPELEQPQSHESGNDSVLGENTGYEQVHDYEARFFGLQYKLYRFLSKFDDDDTESYLRIILVVATIGMVLGFWNLVSDYSTSNSMQEYYRQKNSIYMLHLADYCQYTMSKVDLFKQCIFDRQAALISERKFGMIKHFFIGSFSVVVFFIVYFLKLNYRGRDAYQDKDY